MAIQMFQKRSSIGIRHLGVLISGLFLSIFSLTSCYNEPGFLGNNLLPDEDIYKVKIDSSFKVSAFTLTKDSLNSFLASEVVMGYVNSEIFGSTKGSFVGRYLPGKSTDGYGGPTATADSIFFYFTASGFYGDSTTELNLRIHEITDTSLFWDKQNALSPINVNTYNPTPFVTATLKGKGSLKLPLPLAFGQSLMDSLALTDSKIFYTKFKGFYVTFDELPGYGGVAYNVSTSNMYLRLYYHYVKQINGKDSTIKTSKTYTFGSRFYEYLHDYTKADPAKKIQHLNDTITQDTVFYTQSLGGVYGKITFPDLTQWRDSMPIVIHRAELIIGKADATTSLPDSTISQLLFYYKDGNEWIGLIKDQITSTNTLSSNGSYRTFRNGYSVNITYHFQRMLKGEYSDNSLYVFPNSNTTIRHGVLKSGQNSTPIKLKITYTKLN